MSSGMMTAATSFVLLLCTAIVQNGAGLSVAANTVLPSLFPAAFCSSTNPSTNRASPFRPRAFRTLQASENGKADGQLAENESILSNEKPREEDGDMGTWNPFALGVLRLGLTEPAWTSSHNYRKAKGTYLCASCRSPLFSSSAKYDSGSGWPSFWRTAAPGRVSLKREWDGRIEARCAGCDGHLGHVFPDGPTRGSLDAGELETVPDTDPQIGYKAQGEGVGAAESKYSRMPRFCMNGVALRFEKDEE